MVVRVVARDDGISKADRDYAAEKGEKLRRFFDGIGNIELILGRDRVHYTAELVLAIASAEPITVHARHETVRGAIDQVLDHGKRSVVKHKERVREHPRTPFGDVPGAIVNEGAGRQKKRSRTEPGVEAESEEGSDEDLGSRA